jgi:hypothetical protein
MLDRKEPNFQLAAELLRIAELEAELKSLEDRYASEKQNDMREYREMEAQLKLEQQSVNELSLANQELNRKLTLLIKGIVVVDTLISASHGVYGFFLDGDGSPWDDLRRGGRFEEWLLPFDDALDAIKEAEK